MNYPNIVSNSLSFDQELQSESTPNAVASCPAPNVREIHVDFLLEEEFNVSPSFLEHFIKRARKDQGGPFSKESVKRSVSDPFGEADLVVVYKQSEGDAKRIAILIEDKIGAEFQPSQAERYRKRGELGKGREWDDYWTCLVAPASYIGEGSADGFDAEIKLEEINEWIAASEPARRAFKVGVIQEAIRKAHWLGPQDVDVKVTEFRRRYFNLFNEFFAVRTKDVRMPPPAPSWKGETWFRIKSPLLCNRAYIHHKAPNGFVDLTLPHTDAGLLKAAQAFLEEDMTIEQTGKSAAIRLRVSAITDFGNFERERSKVEESFASVERLLSFYVREQARLDAILPAAATAPVVPILHSD